MKVVLLKDVEGQGLKNDIIEVSDGFAKNFLIKNKLAVQASMNTLQKRDDNIANQIEDEKARLINLEKIKKIIEQAPEIKFSLQVNSGKVFGSISNKMLLDELTKLNLPIKKTMLPEKMALSIGRHQVEIRLDKTIHAKLAVFVEANNIQ